MMLSRESQVKLKLAQPLFRAMGNPAEHNKTLGQIQEEIFEDAVAWIAKLEQRVAELEDVVERLGRLQKR